MNSFLNIFKEASLYYWLMKRSIKTFISIFNRGCDQIFGNARWGMNKVQIESGLGETGFVIDLNKFLFDIKKQDLKLNIPIKFEQSKTSIFKKLLLWETCKSFLIFKFNTRKYSVININNLITLKQSEVLLKIKENMNVSLNVLEEKLYEKIICRWDKKTGKFYNIYEILFHKDSLVVAYVEFSREKGVNSVSGDLISLDYKVLDHLEYLSRLLKDNNWKPSSFQKFSVLKKNSSSYRFLKSLTEDDKIVISIVTKILSIVFEGSWLFNNKRNMNFKEKKVKKLKLRSLNRVCAFSSFYGDHCALNTLLTWGSVSWFIDVNIQYSFKDIYQKRLLAIIKEKIEDPRLLDLLYKFFNNSVINLQLSRDFGFFQGTLLSNLLVNIYWDAFDKFIVNLKKIVDKGILISNISEEWRKATWVSLKELNYIKSFQSRKRLKRELYREKVKKAKEVKISRYIFRNFEMQKFMDYRLYYVRYGVTSFDIKLFLGLENILKTEKNHWGSNKNVKLLDQKNENYI